MASSTQDPSAAFVQTDPTGASARYLQACLGSDGTDRASLLAGIPPIAQSCAPLACLSALLTSLPGPWPVLELQRTHTRVWTLLPEHVKAGRAAPAEQRLVDIALRQCKAVYTSLLDLYHPQSAATAIIDPDSGCAASHSHVAGVVRNFWLPAVATVNPKPVVAISLPNGPLLAMTVLATATYYTAAPVAHGSGVGKEQFKADVLQSHSDVILAAAADVTRLGLEDSWILEAGIQVFLVELDAHMGLVVRQLDGQALGSPALPAPAVRPVAPNTADDTGILLFTSGTSGTKKLVPLSIHSMVCGVAMVVESWGLSAAMRCLNQMPLNHVGGLIRNLFAPVFSSGSVICCSGFDANLFWDCVEDHAPTWYYASPSMHQCILEAGQERPESVAKSQIRLICNAAGGLLPSLAIQLRDTFSTRTVDCTVLPSYGMTECMPISTPPLTYRLEKTGTSGVSVGPEIAVLDGRDQHERTGEVGRICVRGSPVFGGYLKDNNVIDTSCFTADGWFDTGDMGYLDPAGFLYITGRSKEVINRGGELISPFEVEEAIVAAAADPDSLLYGRVSKALAFSATHDVLQEVVGLAVVTPAGAPRACLRGILEAVKGTLNSVKIPVVLVYMDAGLPTNNNKVLRIRLAERLGLPTFSDSTPPAGRYFEAQCPPVNTPLQTPIACHRLRVSHACLAELAASLLPAHQEVCVREDASGFYPEIIISPTPAAAAAASLQEKRFGDAFDPQKLINSLYAKSHGYNTPMKARLLEVPLPRRPNGEVDEPMLEHLLGDDDADSAAAGEGLTPTEATVVKVFAKILALPAGELSAASHFFDLGGDSMGAGKMLNALRKEYPLRLPINVLFANPVVAQLAQVIDERMADVKAPVVSVAAVGAEGGATPLMGAGEPDLLPGCEQTHSSTNPFLLALQLVPLVLLWPMKRALTWTIFMFVMTGTQDFPTNKSIPGRLVNLVFSMAVGRICTRIIAPLVAIAFKWIVLGRVQEGLYPMWGRYHTRWWLTEKVVAIGGKGFFGLSNWSICWYYRLLGAKIGKNVTINKGAKLGEWDLVEIADNAVLERCTVRPFAAERNTSMYLGRIRIGTNASIGLGCIVAAGTTVPADACLGPNSSSWEAADADESNRDLASSRIPGAHWALSLFLGTPLSVLKAFINSLPWLACLVALVVKEPDAAIVDTLASVVIWFSSPTRVAWHYCALAAHAALAPAFGFACVLLMKKAFDAACGRVTPSSAAQRSQMTRFRMALFQSLLPAPAFHKLTELFGTHYETTSKLARAMGAKVGRRVYWPGTGPSIQNFDLLEIGDDVVFGSRSHLVTSDGTGSDYVRIKSGAMVADRVVLLPGTQLGEKTVFGSGALAKRGKAYAPATTWVGSKKNEAICLSVAPAHAAEPGHRASQYYETITSMHQKGFSAVNSTATTLVQRPFLDSERSSMYLIEKGVPSPGGLPRYSDVDRPHYSTEIMTPGISRKTSFSRGPFESSASSMHNVQREIPSATIEMEALPSSNEPEASSSPFGRAFYGGQATYRVWGQFTIFCYSVAVAVISATWWNAGSIAAVQVVGHLYKANTSITSPGGFLHLDNMWRPANLFILFWGLIVVIMAFQSLVVLAFTVAAKWVVMGRRLPGNYDWDKSSYCQRWQLFLKLETFRRKCYSDLGILGLLTGTHFMVLYFRSLGATIGADCALFASGAPSLMFTEPDLLTLGDRVAVDDASLVGHINTRGKFDLNPLSVGARSVLRSGSRLLSGARMEEDSCLLEHTLVMAGDVVEAGVTMQGWPAEEFAGSRLPTMEVTRRWKVAASV